VDNRAFLGQLMLPQVLCGIKTRARTKRGEKQLWRSHPFVEATILSRLVAHNGVLPSFNFELKAAKVFHVDFH
jgi:predicted glutamine amidotransferase